MKLCGSEASSIGRAQVEPSGSDRAIAPVAPFPSAPMRRMVNNQRLNEGKL